MEPFIIGAFVAGTAIGAWFARRNEQKRINRAFLLGLKDGHEQIAAYQQFVYRELAHEANSESIIETIDAVERGMLAHYLDRAKELK